MILHKLSLVLLIFEASCLLSNWPLIYLFCCGGFVYIPAWEAIFLLFILLEFCVLTAKESHGLYIQSSLAKHDLQLICVQASSLGSPILIWNQIPLGTQAVLNPRVQCSGALFKT